MYVLVEIVKEDNLQSYGGLHTYGQNSVVRVSLKMVGGVNENIFSCDFIYKLTLFIRNVQKAKRNNWQEMLIYLKQDVEIPFIERILVYFE